MTAAQLAEVMKQIGRLEALIETRIADVQKTIVDERNRIETIAKLAVRAADEYRRQEEVDARIEDEIAKFRADKLKSGKAPR